MRTLRLANVTWEQLHSSQIALRPDPAAWTALRLVVDENKWDPGQSSETSRGLYFGMYATGENATGAFLMFGFTFGFDEFAPYLDFFPFEKETIGYTGLFRSCSRSCDGLDSPEYVFLIGSQSGPTTYHLGALSESEAQNFVDSIPQIADRPELPVPGDASGSHGVAAMSLRLVGIGGAERWYESGPIGHSKSALESAPLGTQVQQEIRFNGSYSLTAPGTLGLGYYSGDTAGAVQESYAIEAPGDPNTGDRIYTRPYAATEGGSLEYQTTTSAGPFKFQIGRTLTGSEAAGGFQRLNWGWVDSNLRELYGWKTFDRKPTSEAVSHEGTTVAMCASLVSTPFCRTIG